MANIYLMAHNYKSNFQMGVVHVAKQNPQFAENPIQRTILQGYSV